MPPFVPTRVLSCVGFDRHPCRRRLINLQCYNCQARTDLHPTCPVRAASFRSLSSELEFLVLPVYVAALTGYAKINLVIFLSFFFENFIFFF